MTPRIYLQFFFFFFNDTATTEIYTLSLHDALPICLPPGGGPHQVVVERRIGPRHAVHCKAARRSEEHTSELQSRLHLVCRLLLEKKKKTTNKTRTSCQAYHEAPDAYRSTSHATRAR